MSNVQPKGVRKVLAVLALSSPASTIAKTELELHLGWLMPGLESLLDPMD